MTTICCNSLTLLEETVMLSFTRGDLDVRINGILKSLNKSDSSFAVECMMELVVIMFQLILVPKTSQPTSVQIGDLGFEISFSQSAPESPRTRSGRFEYCLSLYSRIASKKKKSDHRPAKSDFRSVMSDSSCQKTIASADENPLPQNSTSLARMFFLFVSTTCLNSKKILVIRMTLRTMMKKELLCLVCSILRLKI